MIIRKYDDYYLVKVFNKILNSFNIYDIDSIKIFFGSIFKNLNAKYKLSGLYNVDVYVNELYGMIIEIVSIDKYFSDIDMRINIHLNNYFLVEICNNDILDYEDVYYYKGKFYGNYKDLCDSEIIYKNTDEIINNGIKVC